MKFIYTVDGPLTITSQASPDDDRHYTFVRNDVCGDVPLGTADGHVRQSMEVTVSERQRWLERMSSSGAP
jgi:hypothetical protein